MQYLEISVTTAPDKLEDVAARLTAGGFSELVIEDGDAFSDFLEENRDYWDYIDEALQERLQELSGIKLYLEQGDEAALSRLRRLLADTQGVLQVQEVPLASADWEESWKDSYPPQKVGKTLVVLPYWRSGETEGRTPVVLNPGLTFGTGAHPSTQMVMEALEERIRPGMRCLDLGSGSGILSIAALRLGAACATGVDIDPKAEDIARENVAYNGLEEKFTALTGNVTTDDALMETLKKEPWDVVLVNIVADVIIALSPVLPELLDQRGELIVSGILDVRLPEVLAALERAGFAVTETRRKEDWRCVCAKRRTL